MSQEMIQVNFQCHKVKHHSRKATEKSAALGNREKSTWSVTTAVPVAPLCLVHPRWTLKKYNTCPHIKLFVYFIQLEMPPQGNRQYLVPRNTKSLSYRSVHLDPQVFHDLVLADNNGHKSAQQGLLSFPHLSLPLYSLLHPLLLLSPAGLLF